MKYYLIAGEASGDLHASNLMKALKEEDPEAEFRFFGGDLMQAVGGTLVRHYREMAFMGFVPVLLHLRTILKNMQVCKDDIRTFQPDVVILVDYPGFNLKIAKYVKTVLHLPVYYYISPKIWAWKEYRIKAIRRFVDKMYCILPFEVAFYNKHAYPIEYVGNPSVDSVRQFQDEYHESSSAFRQSLGLDNREVMAILAGSRKQEIEMNLPLMLDVAATFTHYQPIIAGAPNIDKALYGRIIGNRKVTVMNNETYRLLSHSKVAMVTSGTATLETALFGVPQVVCYNVRWKRFMRFAFKHFFKVKYVSLVNLIAGKEVVKELLGDDFTSPKMQSEMQMLTSDTAYRNRQMAEYNALCIVLGNAGAAKRAAKSIILSLKH